MDFGVLNAKNYVDNHLFVTGEFKFSGGPRPSGAFAIFLFPNKEKRMMRIVGKFVFPVAVMSMFVCVCQSQSLLTHHLRQETQDGSARPMGRMSAAETMNLVITLPLRNQDELDQFLKDVYDPSSPSYRQFLTVEQFTERFGPAQSDYDAVINFAETERLDGGEHLRRIASTCRYRGVCRPRRGCVSCQYWRLSASH